MQNKILEGLYFSYRQHDTKIVGASFSLTPPDDHPQDPAVEEFLRRYRAEEKASLPDELFSFTGPAARYRKLYLTLKNEVPFGTRITYGELGKRVGLHARTVGMAMAKNPIPLLIPCHRVVGKDGKMHGFSAPGGTETKMRLLAFESSLQ